MVYTDTVRSFSNVTMPLSGQSGGTYAERCLSDAAALIELSVENA